MQLGQRRWATAFLLLGTLAGCDRSNRPLNDEEKIVRATLRLLASDGQTICVDNDTHGQTLAIYRTMSAAPLETRRMLAWRPPSPLNPPREPSTEALYRDSVKERRIRLGEPTPATNGLPPLERARLDSIAQTLAVQGRSSSVDIQAEWGGPRTTTRWWLFNRMNRSCTPLFTITDPVRSREAAFVTVTAGHWGTTYALERRADDWQVSAEWSRWLY